MIKIKQITVSGIRGFKDVLHLDLNKKSMLVYGDGGSGKSSLTDALEWFYYDQIDHLSNEEIGRKGLDALRNAFIPDNENAYIEIFYSNDKLDAIKSINNSLSPSVSNTSEDYNSFIAAAQTENLIMRFRDLVQFIIASKTEKLNELQKIIGFSEVTSIRNILKKSANRISRNINYANYDNQKNSQQSVIIENLGQNVYTNEQLFSRANELMKPLNLSKEIKSTKDIQDVLKTIESKEDTVLIEQISFYTRVEENLTELLGNIDNIHISYKKYHTIYTELRKDPEKIKKLQLLALLKEGQNVLKNDVAQDGYCPLCQQEKNKIELIMELNERIDELEELEKERTNLDEQGMELNQMQRVNTNKIDGLLNEKLIKEEENTELFEKTQQIKDSITVFSEELKKDLFSTDPIHEPCKIQIDKKGIFALVQQAQNTAKKLTGSKKANIKFQVYTKLFQASNAYNQYKKIEKEQDILTKQQATFQTLYANFIKKQEEALHGFLTMFSNEINDFYTTMNPNERIEDIKLVPIKDNNNDLVGLTIEYRFFDEARTPPIAYLSESHINCLGLSFFLASAKAFNKENKFFVLDDVISSFDRTHRARFAKLLTDKFSDYQILLLTHEKEFFELVSSEVKNKGWLTQIFKWSKDKGIDIEKGIIDIKERILEKLKAKDSEGLGNDIRIYTEKAMKEISLNVEARVAFRYNELNEKRMAPELLDAIQSKLAKSSEELKKITDIPRVKGMPMFVANITSHDNEFQESIEDLEVMWEYIKKLIDTFHCNICNKPISMKYFDNVENKIRCGCGKLSYNWKA